MRLLFTFLLLLLSCSPALAYHPRIMFDEGHGQVFVIEKSGELQLSQLAQTLVDEGAEVSSTQHPLTPNLLENTDALIISGAFKPYSAGEIAEIKQFIARGGRLAVMVHIGPPVLNLLLQLGVDVANGVIREEQQAIAGEPLNFRVRDLRKHPLTRNLDSFALYGSWPVRPTTQNGRILAYTGDRAWVDLTRDQRLTPGDAVQAFGVVVANRLGKGELLVFGDDALFQNRFLTGSNLQLAKNLAHWLMAGKQPAGTAI